MLVSVCVCEQEIAKDDSKYALKYLLNKSVWSLKALLVLSVIKEYDNCCDIISHHTFLEKKKKKKTIICWDYELNRNIQSWMSFVFEKIIYSPPSISWFDDELLCCLFRLTSFVKRSYELDNLLLGKHKDKVEKKAIQFSRKT